VRVTAGQAEGAPELLRPGIEGTPLGISADGDYYYALHSGWSDVFVAELDPTTGGVVAAPVQAIRRYEGENSAPEWSPDGQYLAARTHGYPLAADPDGSRLLVYSLDTGEVREVEPDLQSWNFHFLSWAPHEDTVLAVGRDDTGDYGHVFRIDLATGESTSLAQPNEDGTIYQPQWGADGKSIYFVRSTPEQRRIVRRDLVTGEEMELYRAPQINDLRVSPEGGAIAFIEGRTTVKVASLVGEAAREEPRAVARTAGRAETIHTIAWTADGRHLMYGVTDEATEGWPTRLWRVAAAGGEPQQLELQMPTLLHLKVHPDGRRIAFTAQIREERNEIWVIESLVPGSGEPVGGRGVRR
jgi:Tol biopolymer transport system component